MELNSKTQVFRSHADKYYMNGGTNQGANIMSKHYELLNQAIQAFKETCEYVEGMEDGQILGILAKGQFWNKEGQLELMVAEVTEQEESPKAWVD